MDVTILQAIQISVWCLFTLRETVIISKTTHIKEKGATASGFTPLGIFGYRFNKTGRVEPGMGAISGFGN